VECRSCRSKLTQKTDHVHHCDHDYCIDCWVMEAVSLFPRHLKIVAWFNGELEKSREKIEALEREREAFRLK